MRQRFVMARFLTIVLILCGTTLLLLSAATSIPILAAAGGLCLLGGWAAFRLERRGAWRHFTVIALAVLTVIGVIAASGVGYLWVRSEPPRPDAFYDPPADLPPKPGVLVRHEPFTRAVPDGARAWRILYTTTRNDNEPAVASAIVLTSSRPSDTPRPIVAWTHGTTGAAPGCAPSVLPAPWPFNGIPALDQLIDHGWVLVGTDYVGLGTAGPHPYLIGQGEGRSALDSIRAARQLSELTLDDRTVVWGHSQGGHAALWTGALAATYAPDVNLVGVAALAPASDLSALVGAVKDTVVGTMMTTYLLAAYSAAYQDVRFDDYMAPSARARGMANRCLSGAGALLSLMVAASLEQPIFARPHDSGSLGTRLVENTPTVPIQAPLFIGQGSIDPLVLPEVQDRFVQSRCDAGQSLEYHRYEGADHLSVVAPDSPLRDELVRWTMDRFAGTSWPTGCQFLRH